MKKIPQKCHILTTFSPKWLTAANIFENFQASRKKKSNSSKMSSNLMLFTQLLFKNSIEIVFRFVHSSSVSCILKRGENGFLQCKNGENLSLTALKHCAAKCCSTDFCLQVCLPIRAQFLRFVHTEIEKKNSKCKVGGEVRNTFTTEPVYIELPPVHQHRRGGKVSQRGPPGVFGLCEREVNKKLIHRLALVAGQASCLRGSGARSTHSSPALSVGRRWLVSDSATS